MTNIEKLIKKYGIEIVKRIPEEQGHLSHVIIYGVQISMYELIEHLKMSEYIASYKHLIGCEYSCNGLVGFVEDSDVGYYWVDNPPNLKNKNNKFYLDDGTHVNDSATLGSYEEYMQLHYPEYKHVWKHQL